MEKERVLVRDNKGVFLKMFKRKFKDEFEFSEKSFFGNNEEEEAKPYDRIVYVVHTREELLGFLQENKTTNVLVCLFNKQFYPSLAFLVNNVVLFDESKTSREIFKELQTFFKSKLDFKNERISFSGSKLLQTKADDYFKAMYFLM
jgi:hypothetical protein